MNHVALLATVAASAFLLPLLVQLGGAAGIPRSAGVAITLALAAAGALLLSWLLWRRQGRAPGPAVELPDGVEEERRARV